MQRGVRSAHVSPDGQWLASIPKDAAGIRMSASHLFWSADGELLYYTPTGTKSDCSERDPGTSLPGGIGGPGGRSIAVYSSGEMLIPAYLAARRPLLRQTRSCCSATSAATCG